MVLDNYWAVAQPIWDQMTDYNQWTVGGIASQGSVAYQKAKGTYTRDTITPGQLVSGTGSNQSAGMSFNGSQSLVDEATARTAMQQSQATPQVTTVAAPSGAGTSSTRSTGSELLISNLGPGASALNNILAKAPELAGLQVQSQPQYTSNRQSQMATKYLEDYSRVQPAAYTPALPVAGILDTRPYFPNAIQTTDQNKVLKLNNDPTSYGPGTGYVGTILSNIFEDNFFLNIELEIRGDPWWMPISNILQNSIADAQATSNGAATAGGAGIDNANFIGGDNEIVFNLRLGVEINEDTGLADLSQSTFYNGVYQVLNVRNEFSNGKFTQVLKCSKDTLEQIGSQTRNVTGTASAGGNQTIPNPTNNTGGPTPTFGGPK